jgi:hypothetical protein
MPEWIIAYGLIPLFYILLFLLLWILIKEPVQQSGQAPTEQ